jgi:hypothetical protein
MGADPSYAGAGPFQRCPPIDLSRAMVGPRTPVRKGDQGIICCPLTLQPRFRRGSAGRGAT